jgi:hypothetical protein
MENLKRDYRMTNPLKKDFLKPVFLASSPTWSGQPLGDGVFKTP